MPNYRNSIIRHLHALIGERHPEAAPLALQNAARYLSTQFSEAGLATTSQVFQAKGRAYRNILAIRRPRRRAGGRSAPLLIGAHYDTVAGSPGADDNASALAVLLEAAQRTQHMDLARPLWFIAFCLEEEGLAGSRAFVARLKRSGRPIAGAIILECVGYAKQEPDSQRIPPGVPIAVPTVGNFLGIVGNDSSRSLLEAVERSARRAVPDLKTLPLTVPGAGLSLPDVRRSDHAAFWDEAYQAVMLTDTADFRNPHYHRPTDTIDTLNLEFVGHILETVVESISELARWPQA